MKLYFCPNVYNAKQQSQARECVSELERQGFSCFMDSSVATALYGCADRAALSAAECDLIVSLGGDGAVLRAVGTALEADRPLMGINGGRLGFLCALDFSETGNFSAVLASHLVSSRTLFEVNCGDRTVFALNDVIIAKKNFGTSADLTVKINDGDCLSFRGDGIVISSPTGSTAYNYSAGGPVIAPDCDVTVITPLYASNGNSRSIVMPGENRLTVSEIRREAVVIADGKELGEIPPVLTVSRSARRLSLVLGEGRSTLRAAWKR